MAAPKKKGPKTGCNQEIANTILESIAEGTSLKATCRELDLKYQTVYSWMITHKETFFRLSPHAYDTGYDALADQCLEIADESHNDKIILPDGREVLNGEAIQRSRLRIDTRLRLLGKWKPKKYGDKMQLSGDADNPIAITTVTRTIIDPKD